jgi:peptide/nickel transport system substrate-binding protein
MLDFGLKSHHCRGTATTEEGMKRTIVCVLVSCLVSATLILTSCGSPAATSPSGTSQPTTTAPPTTQPAPTTKPAAETPKYGGTINLVQNADPTYWDPIRTVVSNVINLTHEQTFQGDWTKGPAGGFGTRETNWSYANSDLFDLKAGYVAKSVKWTIDAANNVGTVVYQIREGIRWALDPNNDAGRLVNGRQLTADDVIFSFKWSTTYAQGYVFRNNQELRTAEFTKTGPWEVTVKVPLLALMMAVTRYNDTVMIVPEEVVKKYGNMDDWKTSVGTGPFMLTDFVSNSVSTLTRNPAWYLKDPIGPGKGNQLPYVDRVKVFTIADASTRLAGLRTGKIDQMNMVNREDSMSLKKTTPQLKEDYSDSFQGRGNPPLAMRIDKAPFSDIKVRRAMNMAIDFNAILKSYFGGEGQVYTWPHSKIKEYQDLYLDPNDYSAAAKELYSYNPEKAKQLLKEAGFPNGFKTSIILIQDEIDLVSIYKDYLSRIGIDMALDVRELAVKTNIQNNKQHTEMITGDTAPIAIFYNGQPISGVSHNNRSMVDDPFINENLVKVRSAMLTDQRQAMKLYRELTKYVVEQAYVIPAVTGSYRTLWWPWIKNYSGELNVGYDDPIWPAFAWSDAEMKRSMGY